MSGKLSLVIDVIGLQSKQCMTEDSVTVLGLKVTLLCVLQLQTSIMSTLRKHYALLKVKMRPLSVSPGGKTRLSPGGKALHLGIVVFFRNIGEMVT